MDVFDNLAYAEDGAKAREFINRPRYTAKDAQTTYRLINHWSSQGLLPERRDENPAGWRKLSMIDLLWLETIKELRKFGLSIDKIRKVFYCIIASEDGRIKWPHLEIALGLAIRKQPIAIFLLVFEDGTADIATENCIDFTDHVNGYQTFLRINLNSLLKRIFPQTRDVKAAWCRVPMKPLEEQLNEDEKTLIKSLHDRKNSAFSVRMKHGKITEIETTLEVEKPKVFETLQDMNYGEMTVLVEKGKPVHATIRKKKRMTS